MNRHLFTFNFNWIWLLAGAFFWTYGLFVILGHPNIPSWSQAFITLGLVVALLWLLFIGYKKEIYYQERFSIRLGDVLVFLACFVLTGGLAWPVLVGGDLNGDPTHYSIMSIIHAHTITEKLSRFLSDYPHRMIVRILNISLLVGILSVAAVGIFLWQRFRRVFPVFIILLVVCFLGIRILLLFMGMFPVTHPPLFYFTLWLSYTFFGLGETAGRLPEFLVLVVFMWAGWRMFQRQMESCIAFVAAFSIGTLPVVWHAGVIVEPSVFMSTFISVFLIDRVTWNSRENFPWGRWSALLALIIICRVAAITGIVLLFTALFLYLLSKRSSFSSVKHTYTRAMIPLIAALPFFTQSLLFGTGATSDGTNTAGWALFSERLLAGNILSWLHQDLGMAWVIFLVFGLLPFSRRDLQICIPTGLFFLVSLYMFNSTLTAGAGAGRYQAEYAAPIAILGLSRILILMTGYKRPWIRPVVTSALLFLIVMNISINRGLYLPKAFNGRQPIVSTIPWYPFREGYTRVQALGLEQETLRISRSALYGPFLPIAMGWKVRDISRWYERICPLEEGTRSGIVTPEKIHTTPYIKAALITVSDSLEYRDALLRLGWTHKAVLPGPHSGTRLDIIVRSKNL